MKNEVVSKTRLDIVRILIEKELETLIQESLGNIQSDKIEGIHNRLLKVEAQQEKYFWTFTYSNISELLLQKILNKVDIGQFNKLKASMMTVNEFDNLRKMQFGLEKKLEHMEYQISTLQDENFKLTQRVEDNFQELQSNLQINFRKT